VIGVAASKTMPQEVHHEPLYMEVEFWVGMAFVLSVMLLFKPLGKFIKAALQNRVKRVIDSIDEASKLRDDAQKLLADYERKFVNVDAETAQIVEQSRKNLQNIKNLELAKLKTDSENKEKEAERRIATATEKAKNEINLSASRISVDLAQKAINRYLQNTDKSKLIDEAIADLDKFIQKAE
ncbi:MAG: ATP synthase F0 subunit B, partial [Alphaproteobacteria bacterium]|nr:ATP synthase F0 subunit B [Alphaproteobacteria bacterium]